MRRASAPALAVISLATLLLAPVALPLAARSLTSADGRAIEAEVLGFDGLEKVRIKRTDTGQTFTLPIATFHETDQTALRAEAAEAAARPPPAPTARDIALELNRTRFDTRKSYQDITLTDNTLVKRALTLTDDDWGYSITLRNLTRKPIEGLRAEYVIYIKSDVVQNSGRKPAIRGKSGRATFDPLPAIDRVTARSDTVTTRGTELKSGLNWVGTSDTTTRDTLHGIWLRVYQGDSLVLESATPSRLATESTWEREFK